MPPGIFTSAEVFLPAANSAFYFFMASVMNFMTIKYTVPFKTIYYPWLWNYIICLFVVNPRQAIFFLVVLLSLRMC